MAPPRGLRILALRFRSLLRRAEARRLALVAFGGVEHHKEAALNAD